MLYAERAAAISAVDQKDIIGGLTCAGCASASWPSKAKYLESLRPRGE